MLSSVIPPEASISKCGGIMERHARICFGEKLSVIDNGDYVTVKTQGLFVANYEIQKLWDALENYDQDDCVKFDNLWDYLNDCKYPLPENQETDNGLAKHDLP